MKFEVFNVSGLDKKDLARALNKIFPQKTNTIINVIFVSEGEIKKLNRDFRNCNEPTDVLSFNISDDLGEIYICPEYIKKNRSDAEVEIVRMIIHGVLHIIGYQHEDYFDEKNISEEMFKIQERYLKEFYDILKK